MSWSSDPLLPLPFREDVEDETEIIWRSLSSYQYPNAYSRMKSWWKSVTPSTSFMEMVHIIKQRLGLYFLELFFWLSLGI